ncbi:MAG: DUF4256 domain-containing protein [Candidatus Gracilibacteria bacterium]|nr:DUF4256 domain-containing protein [Candidatus Gracilibacteria bacterium]
MTFPQYALSDPKPSMEFVRLGDAYERVIGYGEDILGDKIETLVRPTLNLMQKATMGQKHFSDLLENHPLIESLEDSYFIWFVRRALGNVYFGGLDMGKEQILTAEDLTKALKGKVVKRQLAMLKARFHRNMSRHPESKWSDFEEILRKDPTLLSTIYQMEVTSGQPDLVEIQDRQLVMDCAPESPVLRRELCYDKKLQRIFSWSPQNIMPGNIVDWANMMGATLLDKELYRSALEIMQLDHHSRSLLETSENMRRGRKVLFGETGHPHNQNQSLIDWVDDHSSISVYNGFRSFVDICPEKRAQIKQLIS